MKKRNRCKKCGREVFGGMIICHNCKTKLMRMGVNIISSFKISRKKR